jgi:hypothetical protein
MLNSILFFLLFVYSFTVSFVSSVVGAEQAQPLKSLHLTDNGYYLNASKSMVQLKCNAYQDRKDEGVKARFAVQDKEFAIECKGDEVGSSYNLLVYQKEKLLSKIESVVSSGGDCGMNYQTQAWFVDVNNDGSIDVIQRSKFHDGPSDCGGQKEVEDKDEVSVHQWSPATKSFQKVTLDDKKLKQYKAQYDLKL